MQNSIRYFLIALFITFVASACGFRARQFEDPNPPVGGGGGPPPGTGSTTSGSTGGTTGSTTGSTTGGCSTNSLVVAWETSLDTSGNPDQSVLGHVVYAGPSTRNYNRTYTQSITPPVVGTYQYGVTTLGLGTYYLTVTAYNGGGESAYANEVACNFSACGIPCIVVASAAGKGKETPLLTLFSESELKEKKPALYESVKTQISKSKVDEAYRLKLKEDLPPGELTLNIEGYEKEWETDEK